MSLELKITAGENPLAEIIANHIAKNGPISFSSFMENCLYHPEYGYYIADRKRIGREGDFYTSSSVHSLFGKLISRQLKQMWEILGSPDTFIVAEQGAGEGFLCLDILDTLAKEEQAFYKAIEYCLVEISPTARERQALRLTDHASSVRWCSRSELSGMSGCFLSNELVDAFPVHLVEIHNGELKEVHVTSSDGVFEEVLQNPSTPELKKYLEWVGVDLVEGNRHEINLAAPVWMREVSSLLHRGFILTIDYGYPSADLYAPWRKNGTLMCYYQHTSNENPYIHVGEQDITAHIDFTALIKAGSESGLQTLFFDEQSKFLLGLGFIEALIVEQSRESDPTRAQALRLTLKNLILPEGGMGDIFKVLVQAKNVDVKKLLCSRSMHELPLPPIGF